MNNIILYLLITELLKDDTTLSNHEDYGGFLSGHCLIIRIS
jgi:hypothetical protein